RVESRGVRLARRSDRVWNSALLALLGWLPLAGAAVGQDQEQRAVLRGFNGYKTAILAGNGGAAVEHVSQSTLDYFGEMQQLALHGTATDVRAQSLVNQLQILSFRHRLEPKQVKE